MEYTIYTLRDPRDNQIRYVGQTVEPYKRYYRHISNYYLNKELEKGGKKAAWVLEIKAAGLNPIMETLEECHKDSVDELEIYWIAQLKSWGFNLTNMTCGGKGINWKGKKHKNSTKIKMKQCSPLKKTVVMFDRNMNPLKQFDSVRGAERDTGITRTQIKFSCAGKGTAANCYFKYDELLEIENPNWKSFIKFKDYNSIQFNKTKDELEKAALASQTYIEMEKALGYSYSDKRIRNNIKKLIKDNNINISHFIGNNHTKRKLGNMLST